MDAATTNNQSPAQRCIRTSSVLTAVGAVVAAFLVTLPSAWLRGVDWPLFIAFLALAGSGLILGIAGAVVRGATAHAATAVVLIGLNIVMALGVIIALFSFRMGAP